MLCEGSPPRIKSCPPRLHPRRDARRPGFHCAFDDDLVEFGFVQEQFDVDRKLLVGRQVERIDVGLKADEGGPELVASGRNARDGVDAIAVGGHTAQIPGGILEHDVDALQRLAVGRIRDEPAHDGVLSTHLLETRQADDQEQSPGYFTDAGTKRHEVGWFGNRRVYILASVGLRPRVVSRLRLVWRFEGERGT